MLVRKNLADKWLEVSEHPGAKVFYLRPSTARKRALRLTVLADNARPGAPVSLLEADLPGESVCQDEAYLISRELFCASCELDFDHSSRFVVAALPEPEPGVLVGE